MHIVVYSFWWNLPLTTIWKPGFKNWTSYEYKNKLAKSGGAYYVPMHGDTDALSKQMGYLS